MTATLLTSSLDPTVSPVYMFKMLEQPAKYCDGLQCNNLPTQLPQGNRRKAKTLSVRS